MQSKELRIWMMLNNLTIQTLSQECKKSERAIRYYLLGERKIPPSFVSWVNLRDKLELAKHRLDKCHYWDQQKERKNEKI